MSKIEWTEQTWNPITGCTKVSAGCKNCYAEAMHKRLNAMGTKGYEKPFSEVVCHNDRLDIPLKRKKPTTYFVNSMSDLFHDDLNDTQITKIISVVVNSVHHKFQILTKRPQLMLDWFDEWYLYEINQRRIPNNQPDLIMSDLSCLFENTYFGVSVENQKEGVPRIDLLKQLPFNKFLSIEPLLEDLGDIDLRGINWVIVGGESGKNARPMKKHWVLNIKRQCKEQGTLFFFKQWGAYGEDGIKRSKQANGCLIDGVEYKDRP